MKLSSSFFVMSSKVELEPQQQEEIQINTNIHIRALDSSSSSPIEENERYREISCLYTY